MKRKIPKPLNRTCSLRKHVRNHIKGVYWYYSICQVNNDIISKILKNNSLDK